MILKNMKSNIQADKNNYKIKDLWDKAENNQPLQQIINTPSGLKEFQLRATRVWKCEKIAFDHNGTSSRGFIWTVKLTDYLV